MVDKNDDSVGLYARRLSYCQGQSFFLVFFGFFRRVLLQRADFSSAAQGEEPYDYDC